MPEWKNVKVRGDLHRMVAQRAEADRRSISQMVDVLLTQAFVGERIAAQRPQVDPPPEIEEAAVTRTFRTPVAQRVEGQATVDEMLVSCPQCAGELHPAHDFQNGGPTVRCVDCGWVREPQ